ncbi:HNH endonuclease signature motif containing protein [Arthrobacter oryzae]|uniref:HNH endonuclease signature motif containing protein n=1 Tax=Arthrobacter oryzae TaxID=409290 RepID=UPI00278550FA|nr:HNH endonuclease signature motif containing protein [Arthrobacter oryzae]MDQ0077816.1 hypothetical protein [Arthrobacter oryzae]
MSSTAAEDAALLSFREAADFADNVEEVSRVVEYLQIVAAGAVDRTRREAAAAARSAAVGSGAAGSAGSGGAGRAAGWVTGWGAEPTETAASPQAPAAAGKASTVAGPDPADDGCRNAAEFLRARLRISVAEARRRMALAADLLPRAGFAGHTGPPVRPELAAAVTAGTVASRPATIITLALERVRHHADEDTTARMEHALTRTAAENDTDFLTRVARQWTDAIDQDGSEPSEEELHRRQGVFLRRARRGLHHLEIFATPDQYESMLTVMNTATNPRTQAGGTDGSSDVPVPGDTDGTARQDTSEGPDAAASREAVQDLDQDLDQGQDLDRRTRPQRLLDGLVGACKAALTTGALPAAGGLRPQVMVTIDYRDLLERLEQITAQGPRYRTPAAGTGTSTRDRPTGSPGIPGIPGIPGTGSFTFTGPVTASTVRKIACDADIIPVLLGSEGRILDIGRTTRIFPPHIRKAITARDQGCAFPACTIPATWCEAHHITYWSHGGPTSTDNGTLLCSHHHHLIHKEQWTIQVKTGIPWFIPPPHIDPHQKPQRNNYFKT